MKKRVFSILILVFFLINVEVVVARDTISIVGSSTVYPFSKAVARRFNQVTKRDEPTVTSSDSATGFEQFCAGVGKKYPDIANSSRRMKSSELIACKKNGIKEVTEILIGFDGISLATSALVDKFKFNNRDLYLGLAKWVPDENGKFIRNPYKKWNEINPELPEVDIKVYGLSINSGTFDTFAELALVEGALDVKFLKKLNKLKSTKKAKIQLAVETNNIPAEYWQEVLSERESRARGSDLISKMARDIRDDGVYIESESQDVVINELVANPYAVGIIGYSVMRENQQKVHASYINKKEATYDNISRGVYPLSRGLYFYVKKAHIDIVPGIHDFMKVFLSRVEMGKGGYLETGGLIVVDPKTYAAVKIASRELLNLSCTRLMALHPFI